MQYGNAALGQTAANVYEGAQQAVNAMNSPVPRTIASAIGRIDSLNDRLCKIREHVASISDQIGGPRPATETSAKGAAGGVGSAVGHLNDSADFAHASLDQIESILGSIGRALG